MDTLLKKCPLYILKKILIMRNFAAGFPGYRLRGDLRLARMVLSYDVHP
jgi:hypothetical protein